MAFKSAMEFQTIRQLTGVSSADSVPPVAGASWVSLGAQARNGTIEVRYGSGVLIGSPTLVQVSIWRKVTSPSGAVLIDRIFTKTIVLADIAQPFPDVIDAYGNTFYATLDAITGGTNPSVTLNIQARFVEAIL